MKNLLRSTIAAAAVAVATASFAVEGISSPYTDPAGDTDPGIANGGGTLDILGMEVSNNGSDIIFKLSVNGNVTTTDWGNFMIGISTGSTNTLNTGNGWARPIQLNSPLGGMDYWVGSWVNGGGGSQLWSYNGAWNNTGALPGFSFSPSSTSTITYTATLASLGLAVNDTFYFDAYSTGGGGSDSAVDALANPNVSITSWGQAYTSSTVASSGAGLNSYTVVPEASHAALMLVGLAAIVWRRRR